MLGAFLYLFPRARVTSLFPFLFFLPLRFPAWVVLSSGSSCSGWRPGRARQRARAWPIWPTWSGFALGFLYAWARVPGVRLE